MAIHEESQHTIYIRTIAVATVNGVFIVLA